MKSFVDVKKYLLTNLQATPDQPVDAAGWKQIMGFKRGFHVHALYQNVEENAHAFHVSEFGPPENDTFNFGKYDSFNQVIDGVAEIYTKAWKLPMDAPGEQVESTINAEDP